MNKLYDVQSPQETTNTKQKFYITNAIPYVNAKPHVGHAFEFVLSDVTKRAQNLLGSETLLLCGGDENAIKNVQAAENAGQQIQEFIDTNTQLFYDLATELGVHFDVFQKGSNESHKKSSQELWKRCEANDDIYKKAYEGFYCVGCELFYEKDELDENGECYEHKGKPLEKVQEENYFFKLSKYEEKILELLTNDTIRIYPENRKNEAIAFVKRGLEDISISRSNERAKNWGVDVPSDPNQKMYVWFDALNIYQSGIGFALDEEKYKKWWPADVHVIGKGILRFHAIYWPAFLLSANLPLPKSLFVHGYFTVNGQKMSKTLGNVVDPVGLIKKYGAEAVRYYFLAKFSPFADGDFSEKSLQEAYNADLANGLGNLVARVAKLCEINNVSAEEKELELFDEIPELLGTYRYNDAILAIWAAIKTADQTISEKRPWELAGSEVQELLTELVGQIRQIAFNLQPFLPNTAQNILSQFSGQIKSSTPLFPRLS